MSALERSQRPRSAAGALALCSVVLLSISRPSPAGDGRQRLGDSVEELQQRDELVQLLARHLALARQPRNGKLGEDAAERRGR